MQKSPTPQTLEKTGVLHQTIDSLPVDSGLGYPVDSSPFSQGDESSGTYTRSDLFIVGLANRVVECSSCSQDVSHSLDQMPRSNANSGVCIGQADVIQKGIISVHDAVELVKIFRADYASFPFILLPHFTMDSFRRERPFLLLSVLTIASRTQFKLRESLDREFLKVLR